MILKLIIYATLLTIVCFNLNYYLRLHTIDKELIAQQKAEVAKLQGEIKNYQRRLENGRRQLSSDLVYQNGN